jgi:uncharacterized membrane protein YeaQ/YmgE (transglycosylase-associated protein family)
MHLLMFLLFGLVVGVIARWLVPGDRAGGWLASLVIGVLGSFVGGYLGRALGFHDQGQTTGVLMAIAGAVVLLVCFRAISGRQAPV